jgi:hypothetical protein
MRQQEALHLVAADRAQEVALPVGSTPSAVTSTPTALARSIMACTIASEAVEVSRF